MSITSQPQDIGSVLPRLEVTRKRSYDRFVGEIEVLREKPRFAEPLWSRPHSATRRPAGGSLDEKAYLDKYVILTRDGRTSYSSSAGGTS